MSLPRISYEKLLLDRLQNELSGLAHIQLSFGQGPGNRFDIPGWTLAIGQRFQFGDLRIESSDATIVVEAESAGGVGNLAKYWPYLRSTGLSKRFVLVHLFRIGSEGDYASHRTLWQFLVDRMREDLEMHRSLRWKQDWEAKLFTYRSEEDLEDVIRCISGEF